ALMVAAVPLTDEVGIASAVALIVWHVVRVRGLRRPKPQLPAS
ncbi:MAG: hypothetical protein H6R02_1031, partial [Burkholderiaceae bacterium]|nr:hypothetical protein [Burkholderiaceae bacterium]